MQAGLGPARSLGQGLGKVALKSNKFYSFLKDVKHLQHSANNTKRLTCCTPLLACIDPISTVSLSFLPARLTLLFPG